MNMTKLLYIPFIFYFLPAFVFFINEKSSFPFLVISIVIIMLIVITIENKRFIKHFIYLYYYTPLKYFIYLMAWIFLASMFALLQGYYNFNTFLIKVLLGLPFRVFLVYLFPLFVIPKYIPLKSLIKIFMIAYFCIFNFGLLEFIGAKFNIEIINCVVHFISNARPDFTTAVLDYSSMLPRIRSVFLEPSLLGLFIVINLPYIYNLSNSKIKIFKNKYFNFLIKKSIIPLCWLNIFLTQSPIFILFNIIVSLVLLHKKFFLTIKKYFILFFIIICLLIIINLSTTIFQGALYRIVRVLEVLKHFSLDSLIVAEASLATRMLNYLHQFLIFLKYPICGIGFGNNGILVIKFFMHSHLPLTIEISQRIIYAKNSMQMSPTVMFTLLHQTGIIGFILYCIFMIKSFFLVKKNIKYFIGIKQIFVQCLTQSLLILFIFSIFYEQAFIDPYLFLSTALAGAVGIIAIKRKNQFKG